MKRAATVSFFLLLLLFSGCVGSVMEWKTLARPANATAASSATGSGLASAAEIGVSGNGEEKSFDVRLIFRDRYGGYVAAPGTATLALSDAEGAVLYNKTFRIAASDYSRTDSGYGALNTTRYAYSAVVPYGAVNRSAYPSAIGGAYLHFVPDAGGKALEARGTVFLPDELVSAAEARPAGDGGEAYGTNIIKGDLEITLLRGRFQANESRWVMEVGMMNLGTRQVKAYFASPPLLKNMTWDANVYDTTFTYAADYPSPSNPAVLGPWEEANRTISFPLGGKPGGDTRELVLDAETMAGTNKARLAFVFTLLEGYTINPS